MPANKPSIIDAGFLSEPLGKGKGYLIIPATCKGLAYVAEEVNGLLQEDPEAFIDEMELTPEFSIYWSEKRDKLLVGPTNDEGEVNIRLKYDLETYHKMVALVSSQYDSLATIVEYFSTNQRVLLATQALMVRDDKKAHEIHSEAPEKFLKESKVQHRRQVNRLFSNGDDVTLTLGGTAEKEPTTVDVAVVEAITVEEATQKLKS